MNDRLDKLEKIVTDLAVSQAKTDKQLKKTDEKLDKLTMNVAVLTNNVNKLSKHIGKHANDKSNWIEDLFYENVSKKMTLSNIHYDLVNRNLKLKKEKKEVGEIDLHLLNGENIALIEVKTKANLDDFKQIDQLIERYKKTYPYEQRKIHLYYGSFNFTDEVKKIAREKNVHLLTIENELVELEN